MKSVCERERERKRERNKKRVICVYSYVYMYRYIYVYIYVYSHTHICIYIFKNTHIALSHKLTTLDHPALRFFELRRCLLHLLARTCDRVARIYHLQVCIHNSDNSWARDIHMILWVRDWKFVKNGCLIQHVVARVNHLRVYIHTPAIFLPVSSWYSHHFLSSWL